MPFSTPLKVRVTRNLTQDGFAKTVPAYGTHRPRAMRVPFACSATLGSRQEDMPVHHLQPSSYNMWLQYRLLKQFAGMAPSQLQHTNCPLLL